jgi:aminoglycoside phosphotransferase (APT) family kinase protein
VDRPATAEQLLPVLRRELERARPRLGIDGVEPAASGLIFCVFRGRSTRFGDVAVRVPRRRHIPGGGGRLLDAIGLLRQEAVMATHAAEAGIPSPEVFDVADDAELPFTVGRWIEHDDSDLRSAELGALAASVHELEVPSIEVEEQGPQSADETIVRRLLTHGQSIERHTGRDYSLDADELRAILAREPPERRVLHMDLRKVNLLCRDERLAAVIDWGNMLLGRAALELARLAEFGSADEDFLRAYEAIRPLPEVAPDVELVYRLDTAAMLASVHLEYGLDPVVGRRHLEHACVVRDRLAAVAS